MKLNIGCGKEYRRGFVNIDFYDRTVCDRVMTATDLDCPDNSVELIEAHHMLEHLGYFTSLAALSEWSRVLRPRGTLIIEMPDMERAFRDFALAVTEKKKEILNWIFGHETEGQKHLFCFDYDCLAESLEKIGFADIAREDQRTHLYGPGMRITCRKPSADVISEAFVFVRKRVRKLFGQIYKNQILATELERLLFRTRESLMNNSAPPDFLFSMLSMYSPLLSCAVFEVLCERELVQEPGYSEHAVFLERSRFVPRLYALLCEINRESPEQKKTLEMIAMHAGAYIESIVRKENTCSFFEHLHVDRSLEKLSVFSSALAKQIAMHNLAKAKKYLILNNPRWRRYLRRASAFDADIRQSSPEVSCLLRDSI